MYMCVHSFVCIVYLGCHKLVCYIYMYMYTHVFPYVYLIVVDSLTHTYLKFYELHLDGCHVTDEGVKVRHLCVHIEQPLME